MESDGISQVIILIVLIILSAYFSASEIAYTNFNKIRMKNIAGSENKKAMLVLTLYDDYDKLMSTIIIGNNIVNITATVLATVVFIKYFESSGAIISALVMIVIILVFGVITPKSVAKKSPESFAMFSAPIIRIFEVVFWPLNLFFAIWIKIINLIFKTEDHPLTTEDELRTMLDEVEHEGVINKSESDLIRSAIEFNDVDVEDIYTPRIDIVGIDEEDTLDHIKKTFLVSGYSRLPVFQDNIDHITGVIHEKDFYQALNRNEKDFRKIISSVLYVTPNKKISELLKDLQISKAHMAIVIDEYGGTAGLVTMEDIIEELVGEIWDEHDEVIEWFKKIGEDKYLISCNADIDDMFDLFNIVPDEEVDVSTVNGWLTMIFEEIPEEGGRIIYKDLDITVTKAEAKRVLEICVERIHNECDITG
nr:hemolysin family protein [Sedimentibacter sp.]